MKQHGTPLEPEITIREVYEEVDLVNEKLNRVINELGEITQTLKKIVSSVAEVQQSVGNLE